MLFLAGLLGMMVLGSVAVISTGDPEDDSAGDGSDGAGEGRVDGDLPPLSEDGATSLFAQMGILEAPGLIDRGGDSDDLMRGSAGSDLLDGGAGADSVLGGAGDDQLSGGGGQDSLQGGEGADTLHGEASGDRLEGGAGDDILYGHDGADSLLGGAGDDELQGGLGDDWLSGGAGADALHGREGADRLDGGAGPDTLFGGWDNDLLTGAEDGEAWRDYLNGGAGDDTLRGGDGDVLTGGAGADILVLDPSGEGAAIEIMDFDAAQDQIVILYEETGGGAAPEIDMRPHAEDPELAEILLDGRVVSTLPRDALPGVEGILLVPESAAAQLGLA